jgi:nicotinamidase/pyrazinamidase
MTSYDPSVALVVVDVQNDFADPAGSLAVHGGPEVVAAANAEVRAAAAAGHRCSTRRTGTPADTPHFAKDGGTWPVHCVQDTWGAQLHPDLEVEVRSSARASTARTATPASPCGTRSRARRSPHRSPTGCAPRACSGSWCSGWPPTTACGPPALEGRELGWPVTVPWAAVRAVDLQPGDGERTREELLAAGVEVV